MDRSRSTMISQRKGILTESKQERSEECHSGESNVQCKSKTRSTKRNTWATVHQLPSAAAPALSRSLYPDTPSTISAAQSTPALAIVWQLVPEPIGLTSDQHRLVPLQGPCPPCSGRGWDNRCGLKERKGGGRPQRSTYVLVVLFLAVFMYFVRIVLSFRCWGYRCILIVSS